MCAPILALAGGLFSAAGSIIAGQAQAKEYKAQAEIANHNARLAELAGIEELEKGAREEKKCRTQARQVQASQRAACGVGHAIKRLFPSGAGRYVDGH